MNDTYELTVDMLEDLLATVGVGPSEHGREIRKTAGALVYKLRAREAVGPAQELKAERDRYRDSIEEAVKYLEYSRSIDWAVGTGHKTLGILTRALKGEA